MAVPGTILDAVRDLRHQLHRRPETGFDVVHSAEAVQTFLEDHDVPVEAEDVAGHGVVARLGDGDGPKRLWRADLDALPMVGHGDGKVRSDVQGMHHGCGHDGHTAMLAGALATLAGRDLQGSVTALFQPAEETGQGMAACLEHDAVQGPFDVCLAVHNVPGRPMGQVLVRDGVAALASTGIHIRLEGSTSHAAEPEAGRNPAAALADLVHAVQAAPRICLPFDAPATAAVVGLSCGGARYGTSAGAGDLMATLRAGSDTDLACMVDHVRSLARARAEAGRFTCFMDRVEPFPATRNDPAAAAEVRRAAGRAGLDVTGHAPFPWSEDFGHATARWPGVLVGLGAGEATPALHSPEYAFPDDLIAPGIRFWCSQAEGP